MALAALGCCLQYRVAKSFQEKRTFVLTVQAFAFILVAMSQCERSAVCRAQAGEGSRLRPYHVRKILFITGMRRRAAGKGIVVPELSRFYGIIVTMYVEVGSPHSLPHIHAKYADKKAVYSLEGQVLRGSLPIKQHKLMQAWIALHEQELQDNWYLASHRSDCYRIEPLR